MAYLRRPDDMKRGDRSKEKHKVYSPTVKMPTARVPMLLPCGEDDASLTRHMNVLKHELKKINPNKESVRMLMQKTFLLRRKQILDGIGTVHEILSLHTALKCPEEVSTCSCMMITFLLLVCAYFSLAVNSPV